MHKELTKFVLYSDLGQGSILKTLAGVFRDWERGGFGREDLTGRIFVQVKRLLDLATDCGFDSNLWQNYLAYLLATNENSFSLTCERTGAGDGSVNRFALGDFAVFRRLFHYDFSPIEADLGIDCFETLTHYRAIPKKERVYNRNISEKVRTLSAALTKAPDDQAFFDLVTAFYAEHGVGIFGMDSAFRVQSGDDGGILFTPVNNRHTGRLSDLVGYERQKKELLYNTEAFVSGRRANNVLLYGDSGTGKSTSVKALVGELGHRGLRMIELYKHQFQDLSRVIAKIKKRNYWFVIFIDDLSFEENEVEYKFLKAVIEGGVETKPDNILIYATSNRRHLIRETWKDKSDMEHSGDLHRSDTVEEKLSLSARFGVTINYEIPSRAAFYEMVEVLAARQGVFHPGLSAEELRAEATRWELRHGGVSGRTAQQFIHYLAGKEKL